MDDNKLFATFVICILLAFLGYNILHKEDTPCQQLAGIRDYESRTGKSTVKTDSLLIKLNYGCENNRN